MTLILKAESFSKPLKTIFSEHTKCYYYQTQIETLLLYQHLAKIDQIHAKTHCILAINSMFHVPYHTAMINHFTDISYLIVAAIRQSRCFISVML